jgi:hypothetical protein
MNIMISQSKARLAKEVYTDNVATRILMRFVLEQHVQRMNPR